MRQPPTPVESALDAIGNTPVVRLRHVVPSTSHASVYLKLESLNPTSSYKDRMALPIIEEAERRGDLKPGMTVVEATGGSTWSSLAFVCAAKGTPSSPPPPTRSQRRSCARCAPSAPPSTSSTARPKEEALLVGTSTGLNVVAAIQLEKELGPGKTVVTVSCDTGLKYLSGDLFADA